MDNKNIREKNLRDRAAGAESYKRTSSALRSDMISDLVLGSFDWRDYFDDPPSSHWLDGFIDEEQNG